MTIILNIFRGINQPNSKLLRLFVVNDKDVNDYIVNKSEILSRLVSETI